MKIYEFLYCGCIHESSYATMSLHKTKAGAEKAMNAHKEKEKKKYEKDRRAMDKHIMAEEGTSKKQKKLLIEHNHSISFGVHQDWAIGEQELLD
jgi:hypothetical protein